MQKRTKGGTRLSVILSIVVLALVTVVIAAPFILKAKASPQKGMIERTVSAEPEYPFYDIREAKASEVGDRMVSYRQSAGKSASEVADIRDAFVRGEEQLRSRVPTLQVEYNTGLQIPEVIGPDPTAGRAFLTQSSTRRRSEILLDFLRQNKALIGATDAQIGDLNVFADYMNPAGNMGFVELEQNINGIPVFQGVIKAGFSRDAEMVRVINNFAPAVDYNSLSSSFGD